MIPEAFKQSFFDDSLSSPKISCIYDAASQKYRVKGIYDKYAVHFLHGEVPRSFRSISILITTHMLSLIPNPRTDI
jgi:hypothetical protein